MAWWFFAFVILCMAIHLWTTHTNTGKRFQKWVNNSNNKTSITDATIHTRNIPFTIEYGNDPTAWIDYTNAEGENSYRPIIVKEVFLSEFGGWQIKAVDTNKHAMRQFRLDRITSLEHNGQRYYNQNEILQAVEELRKWM